MRPHLFGPISAAFAAAELRDLRRAGRCLAFGPEPAPGLDLVVAPGDSWADVRARLPAGWAPDFVALHLPYAAVPPALWSAPLPLVGLAPDWTWLWHGYRAALPLCDLVFTDSAGVAALARQGLTSARRAQLFGLGPEWFEDDAPAVTRDLDVVFAGNPHPSIQADRLPWLARLARMAGRRRVHIAAGTFGAAYRALLRRARVVFNRAARGECNRRAFEAAAAGALLFQERGNLEVGDFFRDRRECVFYGDDDLEGLLEHYLTHEDERAAVAAAAQQRVRVCAFADLWGRALASVEQGWPALAERAAARTAPAPAALLQARVGLALSAPPGADPALPADLARAAAGDAGGLCALGVVEALAAQGPGPLTGAVADRGLPRFRQAAAVEPAHPLARLDAAEALLSAGRDAEAAAEARRALALLDRAGGGWADAPRFPTGFDAFRVAWERAAWQAAGRPEAEVEAKKAVLRWRLHALLAGLTGELPHFHEAALARPDVPATRAALGCALARAGRFVEAVPHLRAAVAGDPFDRPAAAALFQALVDVDDLDGAQAAARERALLARAAPALVPAEPWFSPGPVEAGDLTSVLVLCCNEVDYTRLCLESVLANTRSPYELVLVDNGSTDETPAYLEEVKGRAGPARVVVLRNDKNLGFPAGCNQGLRECRGRCVLFLNNDTVVPPGWLDGLLVWMRRGWPRVGLVGPVSNNAGAPQAVPGGYADLKDMPAFAEERRRRLGGQAREVGRLTGFCLLARGEVLAGLGGLDEGYGLGLFEDDDLCARARRAGLRLLLAEGAFVHHFGSRTFRSLGVDCRRQLHDNFSRFRARWGDAEAARYHAPEAPTEAPPAPAVGPAPTEPPLVVSALVGPGAPAAPARPFRGTTSLCIIARNEQHHLPDCLRSVSGLFPEIVVLDTGSTDRTREIALAHGARVFDFPWVDDFAAARNACLDRATGDYIFWMDCDDRLDDQNREKLRALLASLPDAHVAYALKCLCVNGGPNEPTTVVDHVRLFRNRPDVRWEHRVHEQVLPALRRTGADVRAADIVVRHVGYSDPAACARKLERDLRLLRLELAERPDHPFTLFNLGSALREAGRHAEALPALRRSLERSHPGDSIVRKLYALEAGCLQALGRRDEALAVCARGLTVCPDDTELLFVEGNLLLAGGDAAGAAARYERLLTPRPGPAFASVDAGLRGPKARTNLAVALSRLGRRAEAEARWREALAEAPGLAPAWLGLAEHLLAEGRWDEAEAAADRLARLPGAAADGERLRRLARAGQAGGRAERVDTVFREEGELAARYRAALAEPSELNVHLPVLHELARRCRHITDVGTGAGAAATAFLYAGPRKLVCVDRMRCPRVEALAALAGTTELAFREEDVLQVELEETDLLFLDAWHVGQQLRRELALHAGQVRRFLVVHGTTAFADRGESDGHEGLRPALDELLAAGAFRIAARHDNNGGLTVLERVVRAPAVAREKED
jgi:GT2 family glycosyltransferase/Flp pilus assembly protein TadD